MPNDAKRRAWAFLVYPDADFSVAAICAAIDAMHQPCLLSPLHDKDVWTARDAAANPEHVEGTLKKPHMHGMWLFDGGARISQARDLCAEAFGAHAPGFIQPVHSIVAMTRYFAHLDNPDKARYDVADIQAFAGARVSLDKPLTAEDGKAILCDVLHWVQAHHVSEYAVLVDYALKFEPDWLPVVSRRAVFFGHYLASARACACAAGRRLAAGGGAR